MGFFKKKSISFTSSPNGGAGCCDTFGAGTGLREFESTDNFGYNYGTQFEEFTTDFLEFPGTTVEGSGTYYRDPLTGSFYNDFFFNLNTPAFGGDGSSLEPVWIKTLFNGNNFTDMYMFPYEFTVISENAFNERGEIDIESTSAQLSINNNSTYISQLYLNDNGLYLSANNIINESSNFNLLYNSISLKYDNFISGINTGIDIYESSGIQYTALSTNNFAQLAIGSFSIIADPTSVAQPIKINILGIKTYVDLAAAVADGLTQGDLFISGNVLNIVP